MNKLDLQKFALEDYPIKLDEKSAFLLQHEFRFGISELKPTDPVEWEEYLPVATGITNIDPESEEESEDVFYYDGGGESEKTVTGRTRQWTFEGHRKYGNQAQDLIFDKIAHLTGDGRSIYFLIRYPNDIILHGEATVSDIKDPGGEANGKGEISFVISFKGSPSRVVPTTPSP